MKEVVFIVIVLNLICEFIEVLFPVDKMRNSIKSFALILVLYIIISSLLSVF